VILPWPDGLRQGGVDHDCLTPVDGGKRQHRRSGGADKTFGGN